MGAGDVDHHRRLDALPVVQDDPLYTAVADRDLDDPLVEEKRRADPLGCTLDVLRRKLRVGNVAALGKIDSAVDLPARRLPEVRIIQKLGRCEGLQVVDGKARDDLLAGPMLVGNVEHVQVRQLLAKPVVDLRLHDHVAGLVKHSQGLALLGIEIAGPVLPMKVAVVGHRAAVESGVVEADDGAGVGGRSVPGGRQHVDVQRLAAALRELIGGGGADDASPDDDGVIGLAHSRSPCVAFVFRGL